MKQRQCDALIYFIIFFILGSCTGSQSHQAPDKKGNGLTELINDFEKESSLKGWEGTISHSNEFPSHGNRCCRLTAAAGQSLWMETKEMPKDWHEFEVMKFDIYNPSSHLNYGTIQIFDGKGTDEEAEFKGQSYFGEGKLFLNTGWNHFEFLVQHAMVEEGNRQLDLNQIRKIRFSFGVTDGPVFIDNIRLVRGPESSSSGSLIKPEDCTVVIDNRNVYTYLSGPVDNIKISPVLFELRKKAADTRDKLRNEVRIADLQGFQTLYQRIPLLTADVGMGIRSGLVWFQSEEEETKILDYIIASCTKASDELTDLLTARQSSVVTPEPENEVSGASLYAPPYPPLKELTASDGIYRDKSGNPVIVFSMLQVDQGPLTEYFAPFNHRLESYTVGGGSRYNIESSPVYDIFHTFPDARRVG